MNISDAELNYIGVGLYPTLSFVNHSCDPNCVISFKHKSAVLKAVRPISPGDELSISYIDLTESTSSRRHTLQEAFYFHCNCPRCLSNEISTKILPIDDYRAHSIRCCNSECSDVVLFLDYPAPLPCSGQDRGNLTISNPYPESKDPEWWEKKEKHFLENSQECSLCHKIYSPADLKKISQKIQVSLGAVLDKKNAAINRSKSAVVFEVEAARACLKELLKYWNVATQLLVATHHCLYKAAQEISELGMQIEDFETAQKFSQKVLKRQLILLGGMTTPVLALQHFMVAKFQWQSIDSSLSLSVYQERLKSGHEHFTRAYSILQITNGYDHPLCVELREFIQTCERELSKMMQGLKLRKM
jgi:hypothetical protein